MKNDVMNSQVIKNHSKLNKNQTQVKGILAALKKALVKNWQLYLLLLPVIVYYLVFHYQPMLGLQIAFKDFSVTKGIWESPWVGLKHFSRFFNSYYFGRLLKNTISLSVLQTVFSFPVPILLALMINEVNNKAFKKTVQLVTYAPHFLSIVVVVGMMNLFLNQDFGFVNKIIAFFGLETIPFRTSTFWFRPMYIISGIWQNAGWSCIIYLAAITGIDTTLYEAATVDGASKLQKTLHITISGIMPTIITLLILNTGHIMNIGFEKVLLMTNDLNKEASDVISTYTYSAGVLNAQYSFSSAIGMFNSVINFILLITVNKIAGKVSETSLF